MHAFVPLPVRAAKQAPESTDGTLLPRGKVGHKPARARPGAQRCPPESMQRRTRARGGAGAAASTTARVSTYEEQRAANIAANRATLQLLGIGADQAKLGVAPLSRPKGAGGAARRGGRAGAGAAKREPAVGERSSKRIRTAAAAAPDDASGLGGGRASEPALGAGGGTPAWARDLFGGGGKKGARGGPKHSWDRTRMHQHLEVEGAVVCTTGCAGYGAVLGSRAAGCVAAVAVSLQVPATATGHRGLLLHLSRSSALSAELSACPPACVLFAVPSLFPPSPAPAPAPPLPGCQAAKPAAHAAAAQQLAFTCSCSAT